MPKCSLLSWREQNMLITILMKFYTLKQSQLITVILFQTVINETFLLKQLSWRLHHKTYPKSEIVLEDRRKQLPKWCAVLLSHLCHRLCRMSSRVLLWTCFISCVMSCCSQVNGFWRICWAFLSDGGNFCSLCNMYVFCCHSLLFIFKFSFGRFASSRFFLITVTRKTKVIAQHSWWTSQFFEWTFGLSYKNFGYCSFL